MRHEFAYARRLGVAASMLLGACYSTMGVPQRDWAVTNASREQIEVRTLGGDRFQLDSFAFTNSGLLAWRGVRDRPGQSRLKLTEPVTISLNSIAVVRVREFDRAKTMLAVAGATAATYILVAQLQSGDRPEAVPRPISSSCPFIYSFDGSSYVFDSETYAGSISRGFERTDVDNLEHLRAVDGRYRIALANRMDETHYTDELSLIVADHPAGTRVFPDETGTPRVVRGGTAPAHLIRYDHISIPARARWEASFRRPADTRAVLVLRLRNTEALPFVHTHLMNLLGSDVYSWYHAINNDAAARGKVANWFARMGGLEVSLGGKDGWTTAATVIPVGPMIAKTVVIPLSLAETGNTVRVRLESSPMLWQIESIELASEESSAEIHSLRVARATTADGRDVTRQLGDRDGQYHVAIRGDRVAMEFDSPSLRPGMVRTVLARTTGHYYLNSTDTEPGHPGLVARLMTPGAFSQGYLMVQYLRRHGTGRPASQ